MGVEPTPRGPTTPPLEIPEPYSPHRAECLVTGRAPERRASTVGNAPPYVPSGSAVAGTSQTPQPSGSFPANVLTLVPCRPPMHPSTPATSADHIPAHHRSAHTATTTRIPGMPHSGPPEFRSAPGRRENGSAPTQTTPPRQTARAHSSAPPRPRDQGRLRLYGDKVRTPRPGRHDGRQRVVQSPAVLKRREPHPP